MHRLFITLAVVLAAAPFGHRTSAQTLTSSLFERYLETLREQSGIPGMSALVLQDGVVTWEQGFGRADVDTGERAAPYTPYLIGDLSQMFGATLLLRECVEESSASPNDRVAAWVPGFPEADTTIAHLAAHITPNGEFKYDRTRFAALTPVIEACARAPYQRLLDDVFVRFGMMDAVPGTAAGPAELEIFDEARLAYHQAVVRRLAAPYGLDGGRMTRTSVESARANAAYGIAGSVRDLAMFDRALGYGAGDDLLLKPATRQFAWTRAASHLPSGLGWFQQDYNGTTVVWQFGVVANAYSSLIVKVPDRRLTFILLANSDQLSAPFELEKGDVNASVFARLFLRIYVP